VLHQLLAYLEDCFLVRTVWLEADSERKRMVNPRKAYPVDTGFIAVFRGRLPGPEPRGALRADPGVGGPDGDLESARTELSVEASTRGAPSAAPQYKGGGEWQNEGRHGF